MTSILILGSTFGEVVLVIAASMIFLAMVVVAVAVITWFVAGFLRATHQ